LPATQPGGPYGRRNFDPEPEFHTLMPRLLTTSTKLCGLVTAAAAVTAIAAPMTLTAPPASASTNQISIIQEPGLVGNGGKFLPLARSLGTTTERMFIQWATVSPNPSAAKQPNFNASDPNAYPARNWAIYDQAIQEAQQAGITVDLEVTGGSPRWASGSTAPAGSCFVKDRAYCSWMPNAKMYGQFVHAVTERYDGHFKPSGSSTPLPAVHFWSFWNEPNFGQDLGPQATNGSTVPYAPQAYRALLAAGWNALQQTQKGVRNTTLVGELAATGFPLHAAGHPGSLPGNGSIYLSLDFMRAVYCLSPNYQKLTGSTAKAYGCPTTAGAVGKFRSQNPGLFTATGFAIHAYDSKQAPNQNPSSINPGYATFPVLKRVEAALDKATHAWGSGKHYPIYNDEYGYITSPPAPKGKGDPSEATAAAELNQAEYISYKDPRIAAYGQYLINDPVPSAQQLGGGFASGLYTSKGKPKATLAAYRLPVWLPKTTVKSGQSVEIWGGARPTTLSSSNDRTVSIQMQKGGKGNWTTIQTVNGSKRTGDFDVHSKLPYSGNLRLSYTYPKSEPLLPPTVAGSTIVGRTVKVAVGG
jgi:hypothetical protein